MIIIKHKMEDDMYNVEAEIEVSEAATTDKPIRALIQMLRLEGYSDYSILKNIGQIYEEMAEDLHNSSTYILDHLTEEDEFKDEENVPISLQDLINKE